MTVKRGGRFLAAALAIWMLLTAAASAETASFRIGVCQLEQHAALADATRGFMDAIAQNLGDQCEVAVQNASGDPATCISIVNAFLAEDVDLILANSTPALQAAYAATGDTPILGVAVTDYPARAGSPHGGQGADPLPADHRGKQPDDHDGHAQYARRYLLRQPADHDA